MPESYQTTKFKDLCQIITKRIDNPREAKTNYYVGLEHLDSEEPKILRHGSPQDVSKTKFYFEKGDILFGRRNWYLRRLAVSEKDGICSAHMMVLRPKIQKIIKGFLPILMFGDEFYKKALTISAGSMSPTIRWKELAELVFPIPPLPEQKKIVNLVSRVDDSITKTQQLLEKIETYKTSKADELLIRGIGHKKFKKVKWFYDKTIEIPEVWDISELENITKKITSGGTPSTTTSEYWSGIIPWTRSSVLVDIHIKSGEKFITSKGLRNSSSVLIPKNNLLVSSRVSVGNISINTIDMAISQDVTGIIINKSNVQLEFLYWYLKQHIKKLVVISQGTTIQGFTRKELAKFLILLPPLKEQTKIAPILSNIDKQFKQLEDHLSKLKTMRKSIINERLTPPKEDKIVQ